MYKLIRSILFLFPAEMAHTIGGYGLKFLGLFSKKPFTNNSLKQNILGIEFPNPIGLGGGFDKNGEFLKAMPLMGFGFIEVGTVTPKPQSGNPKPRLFRLKEENSLQNAMGFNNYGKEYLLKKLKKRPSYPIGINIGKNKTTQNALDDYIELLKFFKEKGDFIVINISSPNTPNLRDLQNEGFIKELFSEAKKITNEPIFLKIAPDMTNETAINLCKVAIENGASGIIATNTTIDYKLSKEAKDRGGISGELLKEKSFNLFQALGKEFYGKTILISIGGIDSSKEAYRRIKAGASLVQIYTAFIYEGYNLVPKINRELIELLKKDGFNNISEAIGADYK